MLPQARLYRTVYIEKEELMPPIVSIVGKSKSGKTTLIEKLLAELKSRGYRVATIKHTHHQLPFDEPGKDSWRHIQAGSEATLLSAADNTVLIKPAGDISLEEAARLLGEGYDLILTEGFSRGSAPKIEAHRREAGPLLDSPPNLIAIASDEPLETKTRQFSLEDIKDIADLLEKEFIKPQQERVVLYVNNAPIPMKSFPE